MSFKSTIGNINKKYITVISVLGLVGSYATFAPEFKNNYEDCKNTYAPKMKLEESIDYFGCLLKGPERNNSIVEGKEIFVVTASASMIGLMYSIISNDKEKEIEEKDGLVR